MKLPVGYVPGQGVHKATAYGGFGQKMLEKMGWQDGQGLGKNKHGMKKAIEVKKKEDTAGVGTGPGWQWDKKYWEDAYNSVSIAVPEGDGDSDSSSSSSSSSDSDSDSSSDTAVSSSSGSDASSSGSSDSDNDDAPNVVVNRDGTITSASKAELRLVAELAKDPWGRWGGREGKMARIRQQEAKEAELARKQLGLEAAPGPASTAANAERPTSNKQKAGKGDDTSGKKRKRAAAAGSDADGPGSSAPQGEGSEGGAAGGGEGAEKKKPKRVVVDLGGQLPATYFDFKPTPKEGWWGAKYFISSGCLEGLLEDGVSRERKSFNEDDQAALYMSAHDNQRQGKRGLGKSTTLKISGGKWEGSKKTFEEEEAELQEGPADAAAGDAQAGAGSKPKKSKSKAKKAKREEQEEQEAAAASGPAEAGVPKAKWIKLAKQAFKQEAAIKLKWKKLWKHVAAALTKEHATADLAASEERLRRKLERSDKFQLEGKVVKLL